MLVVIDADDTLWYDSVHFDELRNHTIRCIGMPETSEFDILDRLTHLVAEEQPGERGYSRAIVRLANSYHLNPTILALVESHVERFLGRQLLLLPEVDAALSTLTETKVLYTKGSEIEQRDKLSRSGLAHHFSRVHVVKKKDFDALKLTLEGYEQLPSNVVCVGNSLKHDILPAIKLGCHAIWIDHEANAFGRNDDLPRDAVRINLDVGPTPIASCGRAKSFRKRMDFKANRYAAIAVSAGGLASPPGDREDLLLPGLAGILGKHLDPLEMSRPRRSMFSQHLRPQETIRRCRYVFCRSPRSR